VTRKIKGLVPLSLPRKFPGLLNQGFLKTYSKIFLRMPEALVDRAVSMIGGD
jgi:hypothetical protein